jgi:hypothetical protein
LHREVFPSSRVGGEFILDGRRKAVSNHHTEALIDEAVIFLSLIFWLAADR